MFLQHLVYIVIESIYFLTGICIEQKFSRFSPNLLINASSTKNDQTPEEALESETNTSWQFNSKSKAYLYIEFLGNEPTRIFEISFFLDHVSLVDIMYFDKDAKIIEKKVSQSLLLLTFLHTMIKSKYFSCTKIFA